MLNNFRTLQSLLFSHGARWLLFRIGYALRKHTGWIRRRMPSYSWNERPLNSWLKSHIPSNPEEYAQWRSQKSPKFFRAEPFGFAQDKLRGSLVEAQLPSEISWNRQTAVDEAERILNGELKYFAHKFVKTGFPPN